MKFKKNLRLLTSYMLIAVMAFMMVACSSKGTQNIDVQADSQKIDKVIDAINASTPEGDGLVNEAESQVPSDENAEIIDVDDASTPQGDGLVNEADSQVPSDENAEIIDVDDEATPQGDGSNEVLTVLGEGDLTFLFDVVDQEANTTHYQIKTNATTVGAALLENNLIEGEDSEYGLYVKKVIGIEADYDKTQTYWAFYINGEYGMTGVDSTDIVDGSTYMFKVE